MADLFISYSRRDLPFVRSLVDQLGARGKDCWVDWQDIPPTAEWIQEIYEGIEGSDAFLFVITPDSASSQTCRDEVEHAARLNKRIVPLLCREVDGLALPEPIASRNWIAFPESVDIEHSVERLLEAVDRDLDHVRQHTRWLEKALDWQEGERDASLLLRGAELRTAEAWLDGAAEREPAPTPLQYEHARASRARATRGLRAAIAAFAVGIGVALTLAATALVQRNREISARKTAESRLVAGEAMAQLRNRLDSAASLAVQAYRIKPTSAARDSVLAVMRKSAPLVAVLEQGCASVNVVRLSVDGSRLAAGCEDGTLTLWDIAHRRRLARVDAPGALRSIALAPDGRRIATVDDAGRLGLWRFVRGELRREFVSIGANAGAVAFMPDRTLAVGIEDGVVIASPQAAPRRIARLRFPVTALAVADDGTIATGGLGGATILVPRRGRDPAPLRITGPEVVQDLSFAPSKSRVAIVAGQRVAIWAPGSGLERLDATEVKTAAFGAGGRLAAGRLDGTLAVWDERVRRPAEYRLRNGVAVTTVAFDPSSDMVAAAAGGQIALWKVGGSELQRSFRLHLEVLDDLVVTGPRSFYAGGGGKVVHQEANRRTFVESPPQGHIDLAATPDGRVVVSGGSEDVVVWREEAPPESVTRVGDTAVGVAVSRDGAVVAQATQHGILNLWAGSPLPQRPDTLRLSTTLLKTVVAGPSSDRFTVGGQDGSVWTVGRDSERERVGRLENAAVEAVAVGADDFIAAAGSDGRISVWRVDGAWKRTFQAPQKPLTAVAFEPNARVIAAGDDAGNVMLWDVRNGDELGPQLSFGTRVETVEFDPSGETLVIALHRGEVVRLGRGAWDAKAAIRSLCFRFADC